MPSGGDMVINNSGGLRTVQQPRHSRLPQIKRQGNKIRTGIWREFIGIDQ